MTAYELMRLLQYNLDRGIIDADSPVFETMGAYTREVFHVYKDDAKQFGEAVYLSSSGIPASYVQELEHPADES